MSIEFKLKYYPVSLAIVLSQNQMFSQNATVLGPPKWCILCVVKRPHVQLLNP